MGCRWGLDLLREHLLCSPACRVLMATHSLLHSADYQGKSQRSDHTGFWRPLLPTYPTAHSRAQCEQGRDMCSACRWGEMSVSVHWITIYTTTHQGQSVSRGSWEESWASVQKDRESCCHACTMEGGILSTNRYQLVQLSHFHLGLIGISLLLFCVDSFPSAHSAFFGFCFRPLTLLYFFNHEIARL